MPRRRWAVWKGVLLLTIASSSCIQSPLPAKDAAPDLGIANLRVLRDPSRSLTAEQVAVAPENRFVPLGHPRANFGFTSDALWLKFDVTNPTTRSLDLALDATRDWVEEVDLYEPDGGGTLRRTHSGSHVAIRKRPIRTEDIAFPLSLGAGETRVLLLRLRSATPISFMGQLSTRADFDEFEARDALLFGGFYAITGGLAVYSLILFAMLRDRVQLLVGLLLASLSLAEAMSHGHVSRLIPGGTGMLEIRGGSLAFAFSIVCWGTLTREVLRLSQRSPRLDRALGYATVGIALLEVTPAFRPAWHFLLFIGLTLSVLIPIAGFAGGDRRERSAWYFIVALGALALPGAVTQAVLFGVLPAYRATEYGNHIGLIAMSCLFSLLVADAIRQQRSRIRELHSSTLSLNSTLEARNQELRFQLGARSRELTNILSQFGGSVAAVRITPGDVFEERYRAVRELGKGGWGSVYEVERLSDRRVFALKVMTRTRSGADAARVAREAEIGSRIVHNNVVPIVDVGIARGGSPYVVMEMLGGGSLESKRGRFGDVTWALTMLRGIASGLEALHAAKVVHRDLKPANVLVDDSVQPEVPKVSDFGISAFEEANLADTSIDGAAETVDARRSPGVLRLTHADALVGTPAYMAPESAESSRSVSVAADIFAFGVLACEMLSGQSPFEGELPVFAALAGRPFPAPRRILGTPGVPDQVARQFDACLAEQPVKRPTIHELIVALDRLN